MQLNHESLENEAQLIAEIARLRRLDPPSSDHGIMTSFRLEKIAELEQQLIRIRMKPKGK